MYWMEKLMKWCHNYVNQAFDLSSNVVAGDLCHGTFYAVCQALIVTFCFRYHEFVKYNGKIFSTYLSMNFFVEKFRCDFLFSHIIPLFLI